MRGVSKQVRGSVGGPARQRGAVLYVALILLVLLALLGMAGMQVALLQEKMAANYLNAQGAFQSAEAAVRRSECYVEGVANRTAACSEGAAEIEQDCEDGFDADGWVEQMASRVPQTNQVNIRSIGPCISGNSSLAMGRAPASEVASPVYQVTAYAADAATNASAAVDTIFRP